MRSAGFCGPEFRTTGPQNLRALDIGIVAASSLPSWIVFHLIFACSAVIDFLLVIISATVLSV